MNCYTQILMYSNWKHRNAIPTAAEEEQVKDVWGKNPNHFQGGNERKSNLILGKKEEKNERKNKIKR